MGWIMIGVDDMWLMKIIFDTRWWDDMMSLSDNEWNENCLMNVHVCLYVYVCGIK